MADFFSNLLMRSSASAKTSGAILQPRLPALFESAFGADELPAPRAETVLREPAEPWRAAQSPPEQTRQQHTELPAQLPATMAKPAPPERRSKSKRQPQDNTATNLFDAETTSPAGPSVPEKRMDEQPSGPAGIPAPAAHFRAPDQSMRVTHRPGEPLVFDAQAPGESVQPLAEPQRTISRAPMQPTARMEPVEPETRSRAAPAVGSSPAARENDQTWLVEPRPANGHNVSRAGERSAFRAESVARSVDEAPRPAENTIRPRPNSEPSSTTLVLKPVPAPQSVAALSRPAAAQAQPGQAQENVVQIHIGRIEVRAVTPPAASQPAPAPRSQPKMSLDDYLRQREEKR